MAKPKMRGSDLPQKHPRRKRASRRGKAAEAAPNSLPEEAGPALGPEHREGRDAYGKYLDQLSNDAPPLLSAKEELELGRQMDDHVHQAVENMLKDVIEADAILRMATEEAQQAVETETVLEVDIDTKLLRWRAARCLLRLNPDRLAGAKLAAQLKKRMRTTEADDLFSMYAEPAGLETRDRFVGSNLRLVISLARRYDNGALTIGELVQEGNIGLMHAVLLFDYRRGWRFSTYATWWIRHEIGRAVIDQGRGIRIPVHMTEFAVKVFKLRQALTLRLGHEPSDAEVVEDLRAQERQEKRKPPSAKVLLKKVQGLENHPRYPLSLDQPSRTDDGDGDSLLEVFSVEPEDEGPRWAQLRQGDESRKLKDALAHLTPIERDVIAQRFGLADDEERSLKEIGDAYKLSRERIRQIQEMALAKLRRDKRLRPLILEVRRQAA